MLEEIKNHKINNDGVMTLEEYNEAVDVFAFLLTFCMGTSDNGRQLIFNAESEIAKSLSVWVYKMQKVGFTAKKINNMMTKLMHTKDKNLHQFISLDNLIAQGRDISDNSYSNLMRKDIEEELRKIMESLTEIQKQYLLLFERGFSNEDIAKIFDRSPSSVSEMKETLEKIFTDIKQDLREINDSTSTIIFPKQKKAHEEKETGRKGDIFFNDSKIDQILHRWLKGEVTKTLYPLDKTPTEKEAKENERRANEIKDM